MKSSRSLQLTIMMGAAATLSACSEAPQSFSSVAECTQSGAPQGLCQSAYDEALNEHFRTAPAFTSDAECKAAVDVDQCFSVSQKQADGSMKQVIMPMMVGYMIGKNLPGRREDEGSGGGGGGGGYRYNGSVYHGTSLYRSRSHAGSYWSGSELRSSNSSSRAPNVSSQTFARHGFGGRSFSGGG